MAVKSFIYWNISKNEYNKIKYESIYTNKWLYSTFPREIKKFYSKTRMQALHRFGKYARTCPSLPGIFWAFYYQDGALCPNMHTNTTEKPYERGKMYTWVFPFAIFIFGAKNTEESREIYAPRSVSEKSGNFGEAVLFREKLGKSNTQERD